MKYTTISLVIFALFGALIFSIELTACPILTALSGVPASCGFVGFAIEPLLAILAALITRKPFAFAITLFILSVLQLTNPIILGIPSVLVLLPLTLSGIIVEPLVRKYTLRSAVLAGGIYLTVSAIFVSLIITMMGFPGAELIAKVPSELVVAVFAISFIMGAVGGFIGYNLYKKIENKPFVKMLQN